ncbi:PolC-type DNA polymerase III [Sphaerisporangium viridialbum]|uniref:3'-5' exonuclease n=1 Tax=Sphaerisporangium viridialbum TaxID=46189 RepID=UPI003C78B53E
MDQDSHLTPAVRGDGLSSDPDFLAHTYVVIDFEALTPAGRPAVPIEVAALALVPKNGELIEAWRYQALIAPPAQVPVTAFDIRQTGIIAAMLSHAAPPGKVMAELDAAFTAPPYRLVAHHAPTEAGLIAHQAGHCPTLAAIPLLDTVRLARLSYPELSSHSLDQVLRLLRIPVPPSRHRAMPDVEVTAEVLRRMLAENTGSGRWRTLHALDRDAGVPPKRLPTSAGSQQELF